MKGTWDFDPDPLSALREGDPGPFEAFVSTASRSFLAFFLRMGATREEAEDLTQEVFFKLFRYAPTYQARERFTALAFRVARNAWIDQERRKAARPASLASTGTSSDGSAKSSTRKPAVDGPVLEQIAGNAPEPGEAMTREEEARRSLRALAELPESQRVVFEMGVLQELPYATIAAALKIPVGTVKSRMFNAVRRLRAILASDTDSAVDAAGEHEEKRGQA